MRVPLCGNPQTNRVSAHRRSSVVVVSENIWHHRVWSINQACLWSGVGWNRDQISLTKQETSFFEVLVAEQCHLQVTFCQELLSIILKHSGFNKTFNRGVYSPSPVSERPHPRLLKKPNRFPGRTEQTSDQPAEEHDPEAHDTCPWAQKHAIKGAKEPLVSAGSGAEWTYGSGV